MKVIEQPVRQLIPDLTETEEIALLARALFREGYDDHVAGHITYRQPNDTFLTLPFHLGWNEVTAGDVHRIDIDGNVLAGYGDVTPGIELHLALHRARPDCWVTIHHHPQYGTVYAAARRVPAAYDQMSAFFRDSDIALYDDFEGDVIKGSTAVKNVEALGDRNVALLANHGVFVIGNSIRQAHFRAIVLEWRCKLAWKVEAVGGGVPISANGQDALLRDFKQRFNDEPPHLWDWAVRRELREDNGVLD